MATLENKAGKFVAAGGAGGAAALARRSSTAACAPSSPIPEGDDAYPIATFTWMLFYKHGQDRAKVEALKQMVEYGLTDGQEMADAIGYIPLPRGGGREGQGGRRARSAPAPEPARTGGRSRRRPAAPAFDVVKRPDERRSICGNRAAASISQAADAGRDLCGPALPRRGLAAGALVILLLGLHPLEDRRPGGAGHRTIRRSRFLATRDLGPGRGDLRHPRRDLGHALQLDPGAADRRLLRRGGRDLPDPGFPRRAPGAGLPHDHRDAGGDPVGGLRPLGHLRGDPGHPAGGRLGCTRTSAGHPVLLDLARRARAWRRR